MSDHKHFFKKMGNAAELAHGKQARVRKCHCGEWKINIRKARHPSR